jgi:HSP20 family molecular chaperone IbpA
MFNTKCKRCRKKIARKFDFCPYCGTQMKEIQQEDYGFLGKDDVIELPDLGMDMPLGGILDSLMKEFSRQFQQLDKMMIEENKNTMNRNGISISISTEPGKQPKISVNNLDNNKNRRESNLIVKQIPRKNTEISEEEAKKFSNLPKQEAETKVRRLSNKIVYEISLPGVKDLKNIFVNKLENSIEIKAFSKDKVYFKLIPVNLPILNYKLKDERLLLELAEKA